MSIEGVGRPSADPLRTVHDEHANALRSYALGLTHGDRGRAEDVVQETFVRAWRTPALLKQTHASARPWLFTVAKHIVIDQWRSERRRPEVITDRSAQEPVSDRSQQTVDRQVVLVALRSLSIKHRQVLLECYYRGASVAEAAQTLGVPPGTIKSRTHYALRALKQALGDDSGD